MQARSYAPCDEQHEDNEDVGLQPRRSMQAYGHNEPATAALNGAVQQQEQQHDGECKRRRFISPQPSPGVASLLASGSMEQGTASLPSLTPARGQAQRHGLHSEQQHELVSGRGAASEVPSLEGDDDDAENLGQDAMCTSPARSPSSPAEHGVSSPQRIGSSSRAAGEAG